MKNLLNKKNLAKAIITAVCLMNNFMVCYANTADEVADKITSPFTTFLGVMVTVVQVVGGFLILKAFIDFATSWKEQNDAGMVSALKTGISGLLFVFTKLILKIFGVNV